MKRFVIVRWALFAGYYFGDLVQANLRLARDLVSTKAAFSSTLHPLQVRPMKDSQLFALANLISITPGTLTVDVSEDRRTLLVHLLYEDSAQVLETVFLPRFYEQILGEERDG
ncbi:MAG: Na+/H+ antiporter subunit E [Candidatus Omnitrophica bacterium]|nr:Na+/H+ antiporter subunit E [Candidatus Omnitrophota bacterium]